MTSLPEVPRNSPTSNTPSPIVFTTPVPAVPSTTLPPPAPSPPPRLSGKAREALIAHLGNIDLKNTDKLVLTPRQRQAISEELEYQQLGLQPFTDPTPWQRLSRDQQTRFNQKFVSLRRDLQDYAKTQFTSLPEDRQQHAFTMFLTLDLDTLTEVIESELARERAVRQEAQQLEDSRLREQEARRQQQIQAQQQRQRQQFQEQPRSQQSNRFNGFQQLQPEEQQFQQQAVSLPISSPQGGY